MKENYNNLSHTTSKERMKSGIVNNFNPQRTMLVDGDILAFMCSHQMEEAIKWDDDTWTLHASEKKSIDRLSDTLTYYSEILLCKDVVIALSSKSTDKEWLIQLWGMLRGAESYGFADHEAQLIRAHIEYDIAN